MSKSGEVLKQNECSIKFNTDLEISSNSFNELFNKIQNSFNSRMYPHSIEFIEGNFTYRYHFGEISFYIESIITIKEYHKKYEIKDKINIPFYTLFSFYREKKGSKKIDIYIPKTCNVVIGKSDKGSDKYLIKSFEKTMKQFKKLDDTLHLFFGYYAGDILNRISSRLNIEIEKN